MRVKLFLCWSLEQFGSFPVAATRFKEAGFRQVFLSLYNVKLKQQLYRLNVYCVTHKTSLKCQNGSASG